MAFTKKNVFSWGYFRGILLTMFVGVFGWVLFVFCLKFFFLIWLEVGLGTGWFGPVSACSATRPVPIGFGQFQPAVNSKFSIPVRYSGRTGQGFQASRVYALSANKPKGFFFPNNDICFFLVESIGQVFIYNIGKIWKKKPYLVPLPKEREREKLTSSLDILQRWCFVREIESEMREASRRQWLRVSLRESVSRSRVRDWEWEVEGLAASRKWGRW